MKAIISVLAESPLYFTMPLQDRHRLVKRLLGHEPGIDLTGYQLLIDAYLQVKEAGMAGSPT